MKIAMPHISQVVTAGSIGFICGIGVGGFFDAHIMTSSIFFGTCVSGVILFFFSQSRCMWLVAMGCGMSAVGVYAIASNLDAIDHWSHLSGQHLQGRVIVREVTHRSWHTQVIGAMENDAHISITWNDQKYPQIRVGDVLDFSCTAALPTSDGDFDYRMYLAMRRIYVMCNDMTYVATGRHESVFMIALSIRAYLEQVIMSTIPAPQAALASGLLLGGDDHLSDEVKDQFSRTGMTHIVAVSGYNVSIIIMVVVSVLIYMGFYRRYAMIMAICAIVAFVMIIGFPASGVRAGIMGVMILCAAMFGRLSDAYSALLFAAAVMLVHNPLLLRYDVGFQLSFLATLGMIMIYPIIERMMPWKQGAFGFGELIAATVSAQILVIPIIMFHFHTVSVISIMVNMFVLPIIPITMLCVFLLLCFHWWAQPIALLCAWCAYALLLLEVQIIALFSRVSWASVAVEHFSLWYMAVYYCVIVVLGIWINHWSKKYAI